jgi:hypothetical protein
MHEDEDSNGFLGKFYYLMLWHFCLFKHGFCEDSVSDVELWLLRKDLGF